MFSWQLRQMTRVFRRRMAMVGSTGLVEVGQFPDVTDLKVRPGLAKLIAFGQEPMDQLVAPGAGQDRSLIDKDCRALRCNGIPPKRATSGFRPPSRSTLTCRQVRGPTGVGTVTL